MDGLKFRSKHLSCHLHYLFVVFVLFVFLYLCVYSFVLYCTELGLESSSGQNICLTTYIFVFFIYVFVYLCICVFVFVLCRRWTVPVETLVSPLVTGAACSRTPRYGYYLPLCPILTYYKLGKILQCSPPGMDITLYPAPL